MANAMVASNGKKSKNAFIGLGGYSGASSSRQQYEKERFEAMDNDPGSWKYRSFADWKKRRNAG